MSVAVLETGKLHQAAPASAAAKSKFDLYYLLFFLSGFPALLYQIVWQRTLFTLFGVNVESVTVVVTVFMLGLGLGSVAGGRLSARPGARLLLAFGTIEISIGAFGCSVGPGPGSVVWALTVSENAPASARAKTATLAMNPFFINHLFEICSIYRNPNPTNI